MQCKYHEEILKGMKVHNMFQKEHLIRIMGTRGGIDEEEVERKLESRAPRQKAGKSFILDIERLSIYDEIKSRRFIL